MTAILNNIKDFTVAAARKVGSSVCKAAWAVFVYSLVGLNHTALAIRFVVRSIASWCVGTYRFAMMSYAIYRATKLA